MRKKTANFQLIKFFLDLVFIRLAPGQRWGQELGGWAGDGLDRGITEQSLSIYQPAKISVHLCIYDCNWKLLHLHPPHQAVTTEICLTLLLYKGAAGSVAAAAGGRGAPDLGGPEDEDLQGPAGEDQDEDGQGPAEHEELEVRGGLGAAGEDALAPRPAPHTRQQENQVTRDT